MRVLEADLSIPVTKFEAMLDAADPDRADAFVDRIDDWFGQRGLTPTRDAEGIAGFDPIESDFSSDRSFFETIAPFVADGGLVELGRDGEYVVGTIDDGECVWEDRTATDKGGWFNLGNLAHDEGQPFKALYFYEQAIQYPDPEPAALYNRMYALMQLDRDDDALAVSDRVVEVAEARQFHDISRVYLNKGVLELRAGNLERADEFFNRGLALDPAATNYWYNKACGYALLGKTEQALYALERSVWDDTHYRNLMTDDPDFDSICELDEFDSLAKHGIRDYHSGQKGEIKDRIKTIRKLMSSGNSAERREAIELAFEYDDRFVYYAMLEGSRISLNGRVRVGGIFKDKQRNASHALEYLQFISKLPEDLWPAEDRDRLTSLRLKGGAQLDDWSWLAAFGGLRELELYDFDGLSDLSGLSDLDSLEKLRVEYSKGLKSLDGVQRLPNLRSLEIWDCKNLRDLEALGELDQLRALNIHNGRGVGDLDVIAQLTGLESLEFNYTSRCLDIASLEHMEGLERLCLWDGRGMSRIDNAERLARLTELRELSLPDVGGLAPLQQALPELTKLEKLRLWDASDLTDASVLSGLTELRELVLRDFHVLESMRTLSRLEQLEKIELHGCRNLHDLDGLERLGRLEELQVVKAPTLTNISALEGHPRLRRVNITRSAIQIANGLSGMPRLKRLCLRGSDSLVDLSGIRDLPSLNRLNLRYCASLPHVDGMQDLPALEWIELTHCDALEDVDGLEGFDTLKRLDLEACGSLERVEGIAYLPNLEWLRITSRAQLNVAPYARKLHDDEVTNYQAKIRRQLGI